MDILGMVKGFFDEGKIKEIAAKVGVPEDKVSGILDNYIPSLLEELSDKLGSGKTAILGFLDKDGDGDIMNDIKGMLGGLGGNKSSEEKPMAAASVADIFEGKEESVADALSNEADVSKEDAKSIMDEVTSQIMGLLGQKKGEGAFDLEGLIGAITSQGGAFKEQISGQLSKNLGFLDKDGDGDVIDDITDMGKNLLGGLFGGKK